MAEEVTNKKVVATLHSHTHNSFLIAPDTSILPIFPKQNFPPINNGFIDILGLQPANTPPSGPDKAFAAHFSDIDHFVVHEFYLAQWYYRFQFAEWMGNTATRVRVEVRS